MAIARVGVGSIAATATSGATLTVTLPSFSTGDLVLIGFWGRGTQGIADVPAGWSTVGAEGLVTDHTTDVGLNLFSTGGGVMWGTVAFRIMQAGDPSTVAFQSPASTSGCYGVAVSYSGVDPTTPIDVYSADWTIGASTSTTCTGADVTIATSGAALLFWKFGSDDFAAAGATPATGMSEVFEVESTTGNDAAGALDEQFSLSTGATGAKTSTLTPTSTTSYRTAGFLMALRPAASTTAVGKDLTTPYSVIAAVGKSLTTPYTIDSSLTAVGKDLATPYSVIAAVGKSLTTPYTINTTLTAVGKSLTAKYKVYRTIVQVGPGVVDATARSIVRTTSGRVYVFASDDTDQRVSGTKGVIHAYKSDTTGKAITQFTAQDTSNRPIAATNNRVLSMPDCVLDPDTGIVHMVYTDNSTQATNVSPSQNCVGYYRQFNTNTDTWGSAEQVITGIPGNQTQTLMRAQTTMAIQMGLDDTIHIIYMDGGVGTQVLHTTRTGASTFSAATTISSSETEAMHPSLVVDSAGDLHLAWFDEATTRRMRYAKRTSGTWGSPETVIADNTDVAWHNNHDQTGSICIGANGEPVVMWISQFVTDVDDPTGNHVKLARRVSGTWTQDNPTRTSFAGVHCHTPSLYMQGDDMYALLAHGDAPELWPGYAVKPSGGSWTGGALGQVLAPGTDGTDPSHTVIFDGSAYVSGTRTSKGAVGSEGSTLDGSASARYDPNRDTDASVIDVLFWDEDVDANSTGMVYYSVIPTEAASAVGKDLTTPYGITAAVGKTLTTPYSVLAAVGKSLTLPYSVVAAVGRSLTLQWSVHTLGGDGYDAGLPTSETGDVRITDTTGLGRITDTTGTRDTGTAGILRTTAVQSYVRTTSNTGDVRTTTHDGSRTTEVV